MYAIAHAMKNSDNANKYAALTGPNTGFFISSGHQPTRIGSAK